MEGLINRSRSYPEPGTNYRFAFKYIYEVIVGGYRGKGDSLSWARRIAKKKGATTIRETWKDKGVK